MRLITFILVHNISRWTFATLSFFSKTCSLSVNWFEKESAKMVCHRTVHSPLNIKARKCTSLPRGIFTNPHIFQTLIVNITTTRCNFILKGMLAPFEPKFMGKSLIYDHATIKKNFCNSCLESMNLRRYSKQYTFFFLKAKLTWPVWWASLMFGLLTGYISCKKQQNHRFFSWS